VTPWNPGLGAAFAILVRQGAAYGIALFFGVLIAEIFILHTALTWPVIVAIAAVVSLCFAAAATMTRRYFNLNTELSNVRDVVILLASGATAATVSAVLLSLLLMSTEELSVGDLSQSTVPLLVGDLIGIAVMTPLVLRVWSRGLDIEWRSPLSLVLEVMLFALLIGLILWFIVGADKPSTYKFLPLLFLPVVAAALRYGMDGSCWALAATQIGLIIFLRQHGYGAAAFTEFQVVMLALTTSGLLVGMVVSERERADHVARTAEVRVKEMQAEAARAARMNLVSGMASALAHEINQPMTASRALARAVQQIIHSPDANIERAKTNVAALIANMDHAAGVVRRMREFLRRGQPHFSTLDIRSVLDDAVALARPDAATRRITIELEADAALPAVFGDRIQLQQVALNLIHNAAEAIVESGRPDGHIRVSARLSSSEPVVEISVSDNGIGVPPGRPLFEPLYSSKKHGMGLGLSICESIVQAHGGRIWLQLSNEDGAEFRFSLPLQERRAP
jgi:signal transduction histidine kinase